MAHVVAPLIGVRDANGRIVYLHQGAEVPEGVKSEDLKRLTDLGLIEADKPAQRSAQKSDDK